MKRNFSELLSKMKPEAQERVKARSEKLLQEIVLADQFAEIKGSTAAEVLTHSTDANVTADETSAKRASTNRKLAVQGSK
jgi:hypothetical protein